MHIPSTHIPFTRRAGRRVASITVMQVACKGGLHSNELRPPITPGLVTMSTRPPAATATTGRPEAMASRATNPRVSVSLGIMKMSALAYA